MNSTIPGQGCVLHLRKSEDAPVQSLPPQERSGLLQILDAFIVPPPQVAEQSVDIHLPHPPLTTNVQLYSCSQCQCVCTWDMCIHTHAIYT